MRAVDCWGSPGLAGEAFGHQQPRISNDVMNDDRSRHFSEHAREEDVGAIAALSLTCDGGSASFTSYDWRHRLQVTGPPRTARRHRALKAVLALAVLIVMVGEATAQRFDGLNVISTPDHPYGSESAGRALSAARALGATTVAIIPFLWQANPSDPEIKSGSDMSDEALRAAIRQAHRLGLLVLVKPQVWVPQSWAGAVEPISEDSWHIWFARYGVELERIARIASQEGAEALAVGTELAKTTQRPEWEELSATARAVFPRTLTYIAHNAEEAEAAAFWPRLDAIGVSLYPPLGADDDHTGRIEVMQDVAKRLDQLSSRYGKAILVGEIGLRSAKGAAAKPWESAEERVATPDPQLQADVIADWLSVLNRPSVHGVLIWRWFTDPAAGGHDDTDFSVQGKSAESVLSCAWTGACGKQ